jgi:pyruvate dehydrogenase phosphatase
MDQARSDRIHASGNGQLCAIRRVAGSLAVTRAFGDFYLKSPEMSLPPFKNKLPYITAEPFIQVFELDGHEEFLILASDGIWEVLTPEEAIEITQKYSKLL